MYGSYRELTEEELDAMVDRISVLPGQLTAYDSGGLEILALRKQAEEELGAKARPVLALTPRTLPGTSRRGQSSRRSRPYRCCWGC